MRLSDNARAFACVAYLLYVAALLVPWTNDQKSDWAYEFGWYAPDFHYYGDSIWTASIYWQDCYGEVVIWEQICYAYEDMGDWEGTFELLARVVGLIGLVLFPWCYWTCVQVSVIPTQMHERMPSVFLRGCCVSALGIVLGVLMCMHYGYFPVHAGGLLMSLFVVFNGCGFMYFRKTAESIPRGNKTEGLEASRPEGPKQEYSHEKMANQTPVEGMQSGQAPRFCPACGTRAQGKFCGNCGNQLVAATE